MAAAWLNRAHITLAPHHMAGAPIRVRFRPELTVSRGKLLSSKQHGEPVHAGCFIRKRLIVLETELSRRPRELARIYVHELFHFVWARLGNPLRASWSELLEREIARGVRGELGWSAQLRKDALRRTAEWSRGAWALYACESFCDTAAWCYAGRRPHPEFTLSQRARAARKTWFETQLSMPLRF